VKSHGELYVHLVWATWDRRPVLAADVRPVLWRAISEQAHRVGANALAVGGIEDHVHVLARYPARMAVSDLARHLKGASSWFARTTLRLGCDETGFRWQGAYGAFSVSRRGLEPVAAYIANQEHHHRTGTLIRPLERAAEDEPAKAGLVPRPAPGFIPG
jgi:REP element-mobilizing transposase RayT